MYNLKEDFDKKTLDRKAILALAGCFKIEFKFIETFNYSDNKNYKASDSKLEKATEWVEIVENIENKIVLQHLLIVETPEKSFVIKHWRQDWLFENTSILEYYSDNKWIKRELNREEVKGKWTQKVYQVDDSPRYEGIATWVHVDGKSFWESYADAPLPRREYTKRSDYNVVGRMNRHEITKEGWIHDQYNKKIIRTKGKEDSLLAEEKGINTYVKIEDNRGELAKKWWKENKDFWNEVRTIWEDIYKQQSNIHLHEKINDKTLYQQLVNGSNAKEIISYYLK